MAITSRLPARGLMGCVCMVNCWCVHGPDDLIMGLSLCGLHRTSCNRSHSQSGSFQRPGQGPACSAHYAMQPLFITGCLPARVACAGTAGGPTWVPVEIDVVANSDGRLDGLGMLMKSVRPSTTSSKRCTPRIAPAPTTEGLKTYNERKYPSLHVAGVGVRSSSGKGSA